MKGMHSQDVKKITVGENQEEDRRGIKNEEFLTHVKYDEGMER
jgi:hypothetical protein